MEGKLVKPKEMKVALDKFAEEKANEIEGVDNETLKCLVIDGADWMLTYLTNERVTEFRNKIN